MKTSLQASSDVNGRTRVRAAIAVGMALLLLAGCATGSGDSSDSPAAPVTPLGYEWTEVAYSEPLTPGISYEGFSAGGALWVYDPATPTTLYGTTDGEAWRTIDVIEEGVGAGDWNDRSDCSPMIFGDLASPTFSLFYHTFYGQGHPQSILQHTWIVAIGPDSVSVSDGATHGLESLPPAEGGKAYRTTCALGMAEVGGTNVIVGTGQWWAPYDTGQVNPYVALERKPGEWEVHASSTEPFFREWIFPYSVTKAADRIVVLTTNSDVESGLDSWSSTDGLNWDYVAFPGPKYDRMAGLPSVVANDNGIAVWTSPGIGASGQSRVWASRDGLTWDHTEPFEADWILTTVSVDKEGFTAYAFRIESDAFVSAVRHSADGASWTEVDDANPYPHRLESAIAHDGGLVLLLKDKFLVSNLSWGVP